MSGFILALCSSPLICLSVAMIVPGCFDYCSFELVRFKIRNVSLLVLSFFLKTALAIWGPVGSHMNFGIQVGFSISAKRY